MDTQRGAEADIKTNGQQCKGGIPHFDKHVEMQGNRQNNENPSVQHSNVTSMLLCGAETWRMNKTALKMVQTIINQ